MLVCVHVTLPHHRRMNVICHEICSYRCHYKTYQYLLKQNNCFSINHQSDYVRIWLTAVDDENRINAVRCNSCFVMPVDS